MQSYFDYQFRVIVIGDSAVGKSALVKSFSDGTFSSACDPTIGVDFYKRTLLLPVGVHIKLQIWDTAGQEKFRSITHSYYRNTVGVLIVFDITNRGTFDHVINWYEEALNYSRTLTPVFVIVGHKTDLQDRRQVTKLEAECLAQRLGDYPYVETSSVTGQNIENAFRQLSEAVYANLVAGQYRDACEKGGWDGVLKSQNAAVVGSIASRSFQLEAEEDERSSSNCC